MTHSLDSLIQNCKLLLSRLVDFMVFKTKRHQNRCADTLAKEGRIKRVPLTIYNDVPDFVLLIYNQEKSDASSPIPRTEGHALLFDLVALYFYIMLITLKLCCLIVFISFPTISSVFHLPPARDKLHVLKTMWSHFWFFNINSLVYPKKKVHEIIYK